MKLLVCLSFSLIISCSWASDKQDYSNRIVEIRNQYNSSPASLIIEAVNKGVFKVNDNILYEDGTLSKATLASILLQPSNELEAERFLEVTNENTRGLRYLLSKGLDPNQLVANENANILNTAANACNLEAVKILLSSGARITNTPKKLYPTIYTMDANAASRAFASNFPNYATEWPIEMDPCFNTFKYLIEVVKVDYKNHGCSGAIELDTRDEGDRRYYDYLLSIYGKDFVKDCETLEKSLFQK